MVDFFIWLGTLKMPQVVFVASFVAAFISIGAILSNRKIARQKNAIDLMMNIAETDRLKPSFELLREIHANCDKSTEMIAKSRGYEDSDDANKIRLLLNYLENVAVGVRNGIYDELIIRDNRRTIILHIWEMTEPFINRIRKDDKNDCLWEHLEWLVCKFKKKRWSYKCAWIGCQFFDDYASKANDCNAVTTKKN